MGGFSKFDVYFSRLADTPSRESHVGIEGGKVMTFRGHTSFMYFEIFVLLGFCDLVCKEDHHQTFTNILLAGTYSHLQPIYKNIRLFRIRSPCIVSLSI